MLVVPFVINGNNGRMSSSASAGHRMCTCISPSKDVILYCSVYYDSTVIMEDIYFLYDSMVATAWYMHGVKRFYTVIVVPCPFRAGISAIWNFGS